MLYKRSTEHNTKVYICYEKAFDQVHWGKIMDTDPSDSTEYLSAKNLQACTFISNDRMI